MALAKIADVYPNYKEKIFDGKDIKDFSVYSLETQKDKIGDVHDVLIDDEGRFRYLIIDTGFWVFGKKVLLPTGRAKIDYDSKRVYTIGLTKEQAENLPEYKEGMLVDYKYEEKVRNVYRPAVTAGATQASYDASSYHYDKEPALYNTTDENHGKFKLYEERLVTSKTREQTGKVTAGKSVETKTAKVSVPIEKERVVIERTDLTNGQQVAAGDVEIGNQEVVKMDVHEESAKIEKQAFVSGEVSVKKEKVHDSVEAEEKLRQEKLQVKEEGKPVVETHGSKR